MSNVSPKGYAKAAAKKVGKTSRTVARDVSRGEKIDPQALADLAGTCLDNGTELDALARLPAAEQRSLAEAAPWPCFGLPSSPFSVKPTAAIPATTASRRSPPNRFPPPFFRPP
jgi:hypothetical protein